jgi:hypothetical protein
VGDIFYAGHAQNLRYQFGSLRFSSLPREISPKNQSNIEQPSFKQFFSVEMNWLSLMSDTHAILHNQFHNRHPLDVAPAQRDGSWEG